MQDLNLEDKGFRLSFFAYFSDISTPNIPRTVTPKSINLTI